MSLKRPNPTKNLQISEEPVVRYNRVMVIDNSDVDFFSEKTLLHAISFSKNVDRELCPINAIEKIKKTERLNDVPELIFLQIDDKNNDGYRFLEEFNSLSDFIRNKCKIVVMSNSKEKQDKYRALLNPSVVRFLTKPLDAYQLKDFIINS